MVKLLTLSIFELMCYAEDCSGLVLSVSAIPLIIADNIYSSSLAPLPNHNKYLHHVESEHQREPLDDFPGRASGKEKAMTLGVTREVITNCRSISPPRWSPQVPVCSTADDNNEWWTQKTPPPRVKNLLRWKNRRLHDFSLVRQDEKADDWAVWVMMILDGRKNGVWWKTKWTASS